MDFRRSLPTDVGDIADIEELLFPDPWGERSITDCISTEGAMCFSAVEDGKVVAYVIGRLIAPEGEIYRVAVRPEKQRRGVGYRLLDFAVKTSMGKGLETLFLEVRSKNIPAIKLYTSYGFRKVGIRRGYYKDPSDDAIVMLKASRSDIIE